MSSEDQRFTTRRKVLAASGSATMVGLAGCAGLIGDGEETDDEETDDGETVEPDEDTSEPGEDEPTESTVTLLVEGVGGYGDDDHDDGEVSQFEIIDRATDEVTAYIHGDHWDGSLPHIDEGEHISLGAHVEDDHGDEIELDDDHWKLRVVLAHGAHEDVVNFEHHGDHVYIIGDHEGETEVVFQLYHDGHVEYETPPITAEVEHHDGHGHEDEDDHGHEEEGDHGHDEEDEDDHGHEGEEHHDDDHEGLTEDEIGHACVHLEEIEEFGADEVDGGTSAEDGPHLSETHNAYSVTFGGDAGYILFETDDDHGHDDSNDDHNDHAESELFAFFTTGGSADAVKGEVVYRETEDVDVCGPMDRYILVEPDHGEVIIELSPNL